MPVIALMLLQAGWAVRPLPPDLPVPAIATRADTGDGGIGREARDVRRRIDAERDAGRITRAEARGFRREARANAALSDRLSADGFSVSDRREAGARAAVLRDRVAAAGAAPRR